MTEQDKQALIKHFCSRDCGEAAKDCTIMPCHEIELIQEFQTTEPDSDTISRAKAIEALDKRFDSIPMEQTSEILMLRKDLRELPPAQPAPHWIPVTERLPEENGEYLCQEKQGFLYVDEWNGEYWECADSALGIVTAWMSLPEPYKEATE